MSLASVFARNWQLKLASLALAVLLWITMGISDGQIHSMEIPDVPVRVSQPAGDWRLSRGPSPSTVDLTVTGAVGDLLRAARSDAEVMIPVDSVFHGDMVLELRPGWVWHLDQTSVVIDNIRPSIVQMFFERDRSDDIPVSVRLTGRLPDSLAYLAEPRSNLLFARVMGPESALESLEAVFLRPFDQGSVTASGAFEVRVDLAGLEDLVVYPLSATILVEVATREVRQLGPVAVRHAALGPGLEVDPDSLTIEVSGAGQVLDGVGPESLTARIAADPQAMQRALDERGEVRLPVEILGAPPLVGAAASPDSVTVRRAPPS